MSLDINSLMRTVPSASQNMPSVGASNPFASPMASQNGTPDVSSLLNGGTLNGVMSLISKLTDGKIDFQSLIGQFSGAMGGGFQQMLPKICELFGLNDPTGSGQPQLNLSSFKPPTGGQINPFANHQTGGAL